MKNNKIVSGLMVLSLVVTGFLMSGSKVNADYFSKKNASCRRTQDKNSGRSAKYLQLVYGRSNGYSGGDCNGAPVFSPTNRAK